MTQQYRFTEAEFTKAMVDAVAERGEGYVYPHKKCRYRVGTTPGCLVGTAVDKLDPTLRLEEVGADSALFGLVPVAVRAAAEAAQDAQDGSCRNGRAPWGEALAIYLDKVTNPDLINDEA